jgi:anti-anti-sigma factor
VDGIDGTRSRPLGLQVHRPRNGVTLVQMSGDVDAGTITDFTRLLTEAVAELDPPRIVLDLACVTALGPDGVDVLLEVEQQVRACGGTVELLAPSPAVVMLLHDAAGHET